MKSSRKNSIINLLKTLSALCFAVCLTACSTVGTGGASAASAQKETSGGAASVQERSGSESVPATAGSKTDTGKNSSEKADSTSAGDTERAAYGTGTDIHAALSEEYADTVPEFVFIYAENQSYDYPTTQGAYLFARMVHERTEGRIQIRIYADAELGSEEDLIDQLTYGGCDFMRASVATLTEYNPEANVLMMPYLYDSKEQMWNVLLGEIGDELMESFEGTGIVPLNWYDAGVRKFYFSEPIRSVGDLAGKRIRVQDSALMQDFIRLIGGEPVITVFDDVYEALETERVAGAENNWNSYESMGHYEVAPYYVLDGHNRIPELVLMSGVTMEKISEEDAAIIRECARSATDFERAIWQEREEESRKLVISSGTEVIEFSDGDIEKLREIVTPLYEQYCGEYMDLIERIRATE